MLKYPFFKLGCFISFVNQLLFQLSRLVMKLTKFYVNWRFKIHVRFGIIAGFFFLSNLANSQACELDFNIFKEKILKNYAGFSSTSEKVFFTKFADSLSDSKISCLEKLQRLQYYFDDLHLNIYRYNEPLKYAKDFNSPIYRNEKQSIAGRWINERNDKVLLIRKSTHNQYEGVILKAQKETIKKGLIYYNLRNFEQGRFEIKINTPDFCFFTKAKLNSLGQLVVGLYDKWDRVDDRINVKNIILTKSNWKPTIKEDNTVVLIKVPECSFEATAILDSLLKVKENSIIKALNLIIDLRDNSGGTLLVLDLLLPYFNIERVISSGGAIICSDDNIVAQKEGIRMMSEFGVTQKIIDDERMVLEEMINNKGQNYFRQPDTTFINKKFSVPKKIAILINYATASSAEMFVLKALQSNNVTLLGEPTAGALKTVEANSFFSKDSLTEITIPAVLLDLKGGRNLVDGSYIRPDIELTSKDWINQTKKYFAKSKNETIN